MAAEERQENVICAEEGVIPDTFVDCADDAILNTTFVDVPSVQPAACVIESTKLLSDEGYRELVERRTATTFSSHSTMVPHEKTQ